MQRWIKKIFLTGFWGLLALIWVVISVFYYQGTRPASEDIRTTIFEVQPGMTLKQVALELSSQGLIRSPSAFQAIAYIQDKETQVKVGEFSLSPSMLPAEIILRITSGKTVLHPVTIPEGYRITEIAALLHAQGLADHEVFVLQTQDKNLIRSLDIPTDSLEGYLFPETYHFSKFTAEAKIVQKMVDTFKEQTSKSQLLESAKESPLSWHEIITLASLIEKETGLDSERKMISSVFHNRLRKNMRLQTDPTVIYAIEKFDGNIRKRDLKIDSPYNTYRYKGLPPGPIASPGIKSIVAAISPIKSDHLYFVSRQDGSHHFSSTLAEHNRAVQKYQLRKVNSRR
ncbi:MAG: endolytic transglycosylase MltG [Nitrospinae bacterium]|nr:endolytic transglycosylase MltG [Nitrospinota bacterium]MBL7021633.1 endolytic transglycosylase MltG [Nitrospinaceae bacterium]